MKLLIVTVVDEYQKEVLQLFKKANIESYSGSSIEGFKNASSFRMNSSWFPSEKGRRRKQYVFLFYRRRKN